MDFLEQKYDDTVTNVYGFFSDQIAKNPQTVLQQVDEELRSLYVRYGNDWTGRGAVGDSSQEATIAALEGVRAECLSRLQTEVEG